MPCLIKNIYVWPSVGNTRKIYLEAPIHINDSVYFLLPETNSSRKQIYDQKKWMEQDDEMREAWRETWTDIGLVTHFQNTATANRKKASEWEKTNNNRAEPVDRITCAHIHEARSKPTYVAAECVWGLDGNSTHHLGPKIYSTNIHKYEHIESSHKDNTKWLCQDRRNASRAHTKNIFFTMLNND